MRSPRQRSADEPGPNHSGKGRRHGEQGAVYSLRLYVSGNTPRSSRAIMNIRAVCDETLSGRYDLAVIDVSQHPEQIKSGQVVVTPTLVVTTGGAATPAGNEKRPVPSRRIVGEMANRDRLLACLDIPGGVAAEPCSV